jgi:hypothetical protein
MRAIVKSLLPVNLPLQPYELSKSRFHLGVSERGTPLRIVNSNVPGSWKLMIRTQYARVRPLEICQRDQPQLQGGAHGLASI